MPKSAKWPHIVYLSNMPTPYIVGRFNALADLLVDEGQYTFEAWFRCWREPDRSWSVRPTEWRFKGHILDGGLMQAPHLIKRIRKTRPDVFVSLYNQPLYLLSLLYARRQGARVGVRVVPTYDAWVRRTLSHEVAKHLLFRRLDGAFPSSIDAHGSMMLYGMSPGRSWFEVQSIDVAHYGRPRSSGGRLRSQSRADLGLADDAVVFIFVGRLVHGKGVFDLVRSFRKVVARDESTHLIIVGDGRDEGELRALTADDPSITLMGFIDDTKLPILYAAADAFVFPTHGDPHGLVVEEAMAAGLPVICTDAAGDIELRVEHNVNGLIVKVGREDQLIDAMLSLTDRGHLDALRSKLPALSALPNHSDWAISFRLLVDGLLATSPRRSVRAVARPPKSDGFQKRRGGKPERIRPPARALLNPPNGR